MHRFDQRDGVFDRRLRHDPVAQIENETGSAFYETQNVLHMVSDNVTVRQQNGRVEIALNP